MPFPISSTSVFRIDPIYDEQEPYIDNGLNDIPHNIPGLFIAIRNPIIRPIPITFDIKFRGTRYTIVHPNIAKMMIRADNFCNDSFNFGSMAPITTFSHAFPFGPITDTIDIDERKRNELLQKLRKDLSDCYNAGISDKEIQQVWDFQLVDSVHQE